MFKKQKQLIGLDLGSYAVKMIQVQESKKGYKLLNLGMAAVPPDAFDEGKVQDPDAVAGAVRKLARHLKIKDRIIATSISGYEVMIKQIELPAMGREELEARMKDELGQYIPYNLDEVNVSYEILETGEESPSRTDVLLVAAKKESVDQFLNLLDPIGMEPAVIDVDFFALSNAYEATYGNGGERVALLDIGASKTDLNVFFAGVPAFTRDLTMGGYQITSRLETRFGLSFEEAERVKLGDFTGGIDQDDVHHIFNEVTESWVEEVQRIVNFYYSNYSENKIDKILLSGGSSRIPGLARVFESALEIPTDIFNPLMRLDFDSKRIDKSYLEYVGPQMAIALGLGLRRLEDK